MTIAKERVPTMLKRQVLVPLKHCQGLFGFATKGTTCHEIQNFVEATQSCNTYTTPTCW